MDSLQKYLQRKSEVRALEYVGAELALENVAVGDCSVAMAKVFGWQALAFILSGLAGSLIASIPLMNGLFAKNDSLFVGFIIVQLGLLIALSFFGHKMSYRALLVAHLSYATLIGVFPPLTFVVPQASRMVFYFGFAAFIFGVMALYGYFAKSDLSKFGNMMLMGVVGAALVLVANMVMGGGEAAYAFSLIAVIFLAGITAYSVKRVKLMVLAADGDDEALQRAELLGALMLYLNFLNIFFGLLYLFGVRRR
jgi:uncharacterized protein